MVVVNVSRGRTSFAINFLLKNLGLGDIALELAWVPTRAIPTDASSQNKQLQNWYALFPKLPPPPIAVLAPSQAPDPGLLRDPLLVATRAAGTRVHKLESSIAFSFSKRKPAYV